MIRYPKGYMPGIPTLNAEQRRRWTVYAMNGTLEAYLQTRGDLEITTDVLEANAREAGLTPDEIRFHMGRP